MTEERTYRICKFVERGWWRESLYMSKLAVNTYTSEQYTDGLELVILGGLNGRL